MYSPPKFNRLCDEFRDREEEITAFKAGEYRTEEDVLQNFREIGDLTNVGQTQVALFYFLKHVQSIKNAVMSGNYVWAWETDGGEALKQRIADSRNYLLLLAACLDENHTGGPTIYDEQGMHSIHSAAD